MNADKSYRGNSRKGAKKSSCNLTWPRPSLPLFKTGSIGKTSSPKDTATLSLNTSILSVKNSPKDLSKVVALEDIGSALRCKLIQPTKYSKCLEPWCYDYWANADCDETKARANTAEVNRLCEQNICHGYESEGQCSTPSCKNSFTICGAELKARYDEFKASQCNDNSTVRHSSPSLSKVEGKEVIEDGSNKSNQDQRHEVARGKEKARAAEKKPSTASIGSVGAKISKPSDIPIPLKDQFCFLCIEGDLIKRKDCPGSEKICGDRFLRSSAVTKKFHLRQLQEIQDEIILDKEKSPAPKNPSQRTILLDPVKDFFSALKKIRDPAVISPCDFILDHEGKEPLTWEDFKESLSSFSYKAQDSPKNQKKVCALLLIACYGLKPRDIFNLRWLDFNMKGFTFRHGYEKANSLTELSVKLLYSLRETQDENWKDKSKVFDFSERTLERAVKEICGEEYNPRDVTALHYQAPTGRNEAFHLARNIDNLNPPQERLMLPEPENFEVNEDLAKFISVKEYGPGFRKHWSKK